MPKGMQTDENEEAEIVNDKASVNSNGSQN